MIKRCNCTGSNANGPAAEYQDEKYGKNMRIHTVDKDGKACCCTICGKKK